MKRFLGILTCLIAFASCDDGDLVVDKINFDDVTISSCETNNLLFKLNEGEALILNIPKTTFTNIPSEVGNPTSLNVSSVNQVVYNFYDGKVSTNNLCDLIPPGTPSIKNQWKASSGVIEITTTAIKKLNDTDNSTRITGYNNNIVFRNITFDKGNGTSQFYESFPFGDYATQQDPPIPFRFIENDVLLLCPNIKQGTQQVYEFIESEALTLDIDPALIVNEVTPINTPRVGTIGLVKNKLTYRLFNSVIPPSFFCNDTDPLVPTVNQIWLGRIGGTIEVTTTTNGPTSFVHVIVFKNVTMERGTDNFQLGNNYKYGELQTIK